MVLGSDSFCGFGKFGENTLVEAERTRAAGLAAEKVLKMATKDAAEHLGTDALGTIATGKLADLLLIDGDPIADITALRKVAMVVKDGAVLIDKT